MAIARRGQTEQRLQEPVNRGRGKEVASAHDVGDALERVVDRHRQMIARREIAPAEHDVAPQRRLRRTSDRAQRPRRIRSRPDSAGAAVDRASHVEAPGGFFAAREPRGAFVGGKRAAGSRIERRAVGVARDGRARDFGAAAKAGIDEPARLEARERPGVIVAVLALPARRGVEAQAEPGEVVENGRLVLRLAARAVQVFNAQQQASVQTRRRTARCRARNRRGRGAAPRWARARSAGRAGAGERRSAWRRKRMHKASAARKPRPTPAGVKALSSRPADRRRGGLARGGRRLARQDPELVEKLVSIGGPPPLRRREPGFAGLAAIIVSQQVSVASAKRHLRPARGADRAARSRPARRGDEEELRGCGLSAPKIRALRALAEAVAEGALDLAGLARSTPRTRTRRSSPSRASARGRRTSFCCSASATPTLFRPAISPCRRRRSSRSGSKRRPDARRLEKIAERWRPWRGVAARMLWAYYRGVKARSGMALADGSG